MSVTPDSQKSSCEWPVLPSFLSHPWITESEVTGKPWETARGPQVLLPQPGTIVPSCSPPSTTDEKEKTLTFLVKPV